MLKKLFGPFPDEPLLYSFDKILGLFHKIDSKLKRNYVSNNGGTNETGIVTPIVEEIVDVIVETTTENVVTSTTSIQGNNTRLEKLETYSRTSTKCTNEDNKKLVSNEVVEVTEIHLHKSTPRSIVKRSSSMECNYTLSKINVAKRGQPARKAREKNVNNGAKSLTKKYKSVNKQSIGFGDTVDVLESNFEKKLLISNEKNRIESILKRETKQRNVLTAPNRIKWNGTERGSKTMNELVSRKVIKTEWAITRIFTFDDDSQTYEVMKKDKVLEENGSIKRIFAIAPNLTTIAYDPLQQKCKKR